MSSESKHVQSLIARCLNTAREKTGISIATLSFFSCSHFFSCPTFRICGGDISQWLGTARAVPFAFSIRPKNFRKFRRRALRGNAECFDRDNRGNAGFVLWLVGVCSRFGDEFRRAVCTWEVVEKALSAKERLVVIVLLMKYITLSGREETYKFLGISYNLKTCTSKTKIFFKYNCCVVELFYDERLWKLQISTELYK